VFVVGQVGSRYTSCHAVVLEKGQLMITIGSSSLACQIGAYIITYGGTYCMLGAWLVGN
jgi:hypothetical protein